MDLIPSMDPVALATWAIDGLLALLLLWLAARTLASPGLLEAVVLFVGFGLTLALVWVRLDAPDIALAEAAIGAGLTGALLLAALARLPLSARAEEPAESNRTEHTQPKERRDAET